MKNPYKVLGLKQDASNSDIVKSQIKALKSKKYTMKDNRSTGDPQKASPAIGRRLYFPDFG